METSVGYMDPKELSIGHMYPMETSMGYMYAMESSMGYMYLMEVSMGYIKHHTTDAQTKTEGRRQSWRNNGFPPSPPKSP